MKHRHWDRASPTVPRPKRLEWDGQQGGQLPLPEIGRSTKLAKRVHRCAQDAIRGGGRKATSGLHGR